MNFRLKPYSQADYPIHQRVDLLAAQNEISGLINVISTWKKGQERNIFLLYAESPSSRYKILEQVVQQLLYIGFQVFSVFDGDSGNSIQEISEGRSVIVIAPVFISGKRDIQWDFLNRMLLEQSEKRDVAVPIIAIVDYDAKAKLGGYSEELPKTREEKNNPYQILPLEKYLFILLTIGSVLFFFTFRFMQLLKNLDSSLDTFYLIPNYLFIADFCFFLTALVISVFVLYSLGSNRTRSSITGLVLLTLFVVFIFPVQENFVWHNEFADLKVTTYHVFLPAVDFIAYGILNFGPKTLHISSWTGNIIYFSIIASTGFILTLAVFLLAKRAVKPYIRFIFLAISLLALALGYIHSFAYRILTNYAAVGHASLIVSTLPIYTWIMNRFSPFNFFSFVIYSNGGFSSLLNVTYPGLIDILLLAFPVFSIYSAFITVKARHQMQ